MSVIILQGQQLTNVAAQSIAERFNGTLHTRSTHYRIRTARTVSNDALKECRAKQPYDINILPEDFDASSQRLLLSDMDSTLVSIESIDELADIAGVKQQVSSLTQASMSGELRFEQSLLRRTALLVGLDVSALERVYRERLRLNAGAEALIAGLKARGIRSAVVSGGYTYFAERLKDRLDLDYSHANTLEIVDGRLTGHVLGSIVGAEGKRDFLLGLCEALRLSSSQTMAMGDGANDLLMMAHAGLSIAYHAKPAVQAQAKIVINHCGLDALLAFLDIS